MEEERNFELPVKEKVKNSHLISREELKYILIASGFSFLYFIYILPFLLKLGIENTPSIVQFLFFSIGIYFVYFCIFKSFAMENRKSLKFSLVMILPFIALDLVNPEYHINILTGALEKGATLGAATSDYFIGTLWGYLGIHGYPLVIFVYLITFIIILIIAAMIKKNFVDII